jgi:outer membrane receptor protein involved in Fe transport
MPLDTLRPEIFVLDELVWNYGFVSGHNNLVSLGKASSRGIEITGKTYLSQNISSHFGIAWFRSRYLDLNKDWRSRIGDNKLLVNILLNYHPTPKWSIALNWIYAGGTPYTPYDQKLTELNNREIFLKDDINRGRLPDYHVLNMKFSRMFSFKNSSLNLYIELLNAYDQTNISYYKWDEKSRKQKSEKQLPFLPIVGMEYSF